MALIPGEVQLEIVPGALHLFERPDALEPVALRKVMLRQPDEDLSTNTYYGDGTAIEPNVVEEIRQAYAREALSFDWEAGDLLMLDNMLCSHSRAPFQGERQVFVIMTEKVLRSQMPEPARAWNQSDNN